MLKSESTPIARRVLLTIPLLLCPGGAILAVVATLFALVPDISMGGRVLGTFYALLGAIYGVAHAMNVYKFWFLGELHWCLLANSRTLAILRHGAPPRFLKRRDCVSMKREPFVLVFADGTRYEIRCDGVGHMKTLTDFIYPLYGMWSRAAPLKTPAQIRSIEPVESSKRVGSSN